MLSEEELQKRFALVYKPESYRRLIAEKEVIIHCHHYNARLQHTIEGAKQINGKKIISSSAEEVFSEHVSNAFRTDESLDIKWQVAAGLYAHLGYGRLDFSQINEGVVHASASHYVEGWNSGFKEVNEPVCSFTEGYIQGVIHAIAGEAVYVHEEKCMNTGSDQCRFVIDKNRSEAFQSNPKQPLTFVPKSKGDFVKSPNINEQVIIDALVEMPIYGNEEGLIPAFGVYLANTPADFYNLICIRFVEEMKRQKLFSTAKKLLLFAGETCGINTFRGIMHSSEWQGLIAPMVKEQQDNLFGIITISNALGWGNWHVREHESSETLKMESLNGYEALGFLEYRGEATDPQCLMLTGVAAGIMELIYGEGTVEERFGTYISEENDCICTHNESCLIALETL